jgi:hypothetical protein
MKFIDNKYSRLYFSIIAHAKEHQLEIFEKHHIIPKSLGGSDDSSNLVKLSFRQHFICHKLLTKMVHSKNDKRKMTFALHMMSLNSSRLSRTSKSYEYTRKLRRELGVSEETKEKMRQSMIGKNVGKTISVAGKAKMSIAAQNRIVSCETREKISERLKREWAEGARTVSSNFKQTGKSMLGKNHSAETRLKQSNAAKNDPRRKLPRGPLSEETKQKIAQKAKERWAKIRNCREASRTT